MERLLALVEAGEVQAAFHREAGSAHQEREGFVYPTGALHAVALVVLNIMTAVSQREREAIGERTGDAPKEP